MRNEDEIRRLLRTGMDDDQTSSRPLVAASRARRQIEIETALLNQVVSIINSPPRYSAMR